MAGRPRYLSAAAASLRVVRWLLLIASAATALATATAATRAEAADAIEPSSASFAAGAGGRTEYRLAIMEQYNGLEGRSDDDEMIHVPLRSRASRGAPSAYRAKINLFRKLGSFLGINATQGHAFFYDLAKDRIGFAESYNCLPKTNPGGFTDDDMFELPSVQIQTVTGPGSSEEERESPIDGGMPGAGPAGAPKPRVPGAHGPMEEDLGTCVTATCISFVTVGYCVVVIAMAVAYKKWKPKDRSKRFDREVHQGEDVLDDQTEVLNPTFEEHVRITGGASLRGSAVLA